MARRASIERAAGLALLLLAGPAAAVEPPVDPLPVVEIAPGDYVHHGLHEEIAPDDGGDIANVGFIVGEQAVAVIDTGGSARIGARLLAAIRRVTDLPIRYVVNTHVHPDHVFGDAAFEASGAQFVGHANLPRALAARGAYYLAELQRTLGAAAEGSRVVAPDITVADRATLELGGRTLEVVAWPAAHTDNDLTVYDRASGTLWAGDLLFLKRTPVIDGSLNGWLAAIDELRRLPAERVVPGHGPVSAPWPRALDAEAGYLSTLRDEIRRIIARGGTIEQALKTAGQGSRADWLLFDRTNARNVVTAFTELEWE
ncbi:quinoprotein relay system zinc metallohydrolase 2 [Tistlia consotensis]|uniref:Quinoprotein relay system zinc metallohydrolase 2 n=1 Tax=Tistlia consotensis USBA 355 TaxID=560819 RepID=A0A1Y6CV32_9PROT|nr:quinoprotein relay system zinc metallohydrolase 2 [Tistlia consotensis]SMF80277.1 quinoprotein relay system zinc metallohydrolase 2 [Tistlia consotensis USBA 355]SNR62399.1 quinoprotein relay system zinc metallohydrolase 2 [Tistlia consotensis]